MTKEEWKDFITCPKEVSDKIIAYYGLNNPGTYIYHGERIYDKETKKHYYLITWLSLIWAIKPFDAELNRMYTWYLQKDDSMEFDIVATKLLKKRVREGFYKKEIK